MSNHPIPTNNLLIRTSRYFPRPSYQDKVVPAYVKSLNGEHEGLFNPGMYYYAY